jgi:hypothetical protein
VQDDLAMGVRMAAPKVIRQGGPIACSDYLHTQAAIAVDSFRR